MNTTLYFAQYVRSFFEDYVVCQRNLSINSIWSYRDAMKLFIQFVSKALRKTPVKLLVTDLAESLVIGFLKDLEKKRGNSIQTRNHRLTALRCLFEYISFREPLLLEHCRKIANIPLKRGAEQTQVSYLTKHEIKAILDVVDRNTPCGNRDYMLILFMYNVGARVQEVADVRISWLSLHSPYKVEIFGKGNKWRTCPLWESTARALKQYIQERNCNSEQSDRLFLNRSNCPITRYGIAYIIRKYVKEASLSMPSLRGKNITPHTLRHTTGMHLLQSGVELNVIKSWLGHSSIATTNRYVEIDLEMKANAMKACELTPNKRSVKRWHSNSKILGWLESL